METKVQDHSNLIYRGFYVNDVNNSAYVAALRRIQKAKDDEQRISSLEEKVDNISNLLETLISKLS